MKTNRRRFLATGAGAGALFLLPGVAQAGKPRAKIITSTGVTYTTNPTTLRCDIRRPFSGGPFPVVVVVVDSGWSSNDFSNGAGMAIRLAQDEGFASIMIGLRTAPGALAPAPMEDCADLISFITANAAAYRLDPNSIAFMGGSGGGHVSLFAAFGTYLSADQFARVRCVVAGSPPCELRTMDDDGVVGFNPIAEGFLGVTEVASPSTWEFFSPSLRVGPDTKPIILANSVGDPVPPAQSARLAVALTAHEIEHRTMVIPGTQHGGGVLVNPLVWAEVVPWLHRYLD